MSRITNPLIIDFKVVYQLFQIWEIRRWPQNKHRNYNQIVIFHFIMQTEKMKAFARELIICDVPLNPFLFYQCFLQISSSHKVIVNGIRIVQIVYFMHQICLKEYYVIFSSSHLNRLLS